jgi:hypothetical protein
MTRSFWFELVYSIPFFVIIMLKKEGKKEERKEGRKEEGMKEGKTEGRK